MALAVGKSLHTLIAVLHLLLVFSLRGLNVNCSDLRALAMSKFPGDHYNAPSSAIISPSSIYITSLQYSATTGSVTAPTSRPMLRSSPVNEGVVDESVAARAMKARDEEGGNNYFSGG